LYGLRAEHVGFPLNMARLLRVRALCDKALATDSNHPLSNYLMGRWHLKMPAYLGGNRPRAVEHLSAALRYSPAGDTRIRTALAEAWLSIGQTSHARAELTRVLDETPVDHPRHAIRTQRAKKLLEELV
jgi:hypothetical protein